MIRVLLAEDQLMFRTAVRRLLELEHDIQVVGEVVSHSGPDRVVIR